MIVSNDKSDNTVSRFVSTGESTTECVQQKSMGFLWIIDQRTDIRQSQSLTNL